MAAGGICGWWAPRGAGSAHRGFTVPGRSATSRVSADRWKPASTWGNAPTPGCHNVCYRTPTFPCLSQPVTRRAARGQAKREAADAKKQAGLPGWVRVPPVWSKVSVLGWAESAGWWGGPSVVVSPAFDGAVGSDTACVL